MKNTAHQKRVLEVWEEYIQELCDRQKIQIMKTQPEAEVDEEEKGSCVSRIEIKRLTMDMKS